MDNTMKIGVAGAGAMGTGIAQVAAMAGHEVVVYDTFRESLDRSSKSLSDDLQKLESKGKIKTGDASVIRDRISHSSDLASLHGCGMVIEAVVEQDRKSTRLNSSHT